jgi:putative nucleotidyltransferase with HDIG domain
VWVISSHCTAITFSSRHSALAPSRTSSSTIAWTSRILGVFRSTTSSLVSSVAASAGSAAFLLPAGTIVPERGVPPSMMNFSMSEGASVTKLISLSGSGRRLDNLPRMAPTREEAWELVEEWVQSDSLRKHLLGVETGMRAYARKWGEDEELYAVTGLLHDLDYERYPDLETGHPRKALELFRERGFPQELTDAVAGHATFLGVPRESRMAKTLYAVDELSGFIAACALVRPTGVEGMTPKSVKKKLKQPSFAAGVNRDEVRDGAEELGMDFDEHVAFLIAAMEERADELGLEGSG